MWPLPTRKKRSMSIQKVCLTAVAAALLSLVATGCNKTLAPGSYNLDTADMAAKAKAQADKFPGPPEQKEAMLQKMSEMISKMKFTMTFNKDGTATSEMSQPSPMNPADVKEVSDKGKWEEKDGVLTVSFEGPAFGKDGPLKCSKVAETTSISCLPENMKGEDPLVFKRAAE